MPYARNAGVRIRYEVEGTGLPLVLHTGFSSRLEAWHRNGAVERLADRYQLIVRRFTRTSIPV